MTENKRFTTNGYYIYDHFKEDSWLVNEVEAQEIVDIMNNLDTKARENSKALSTLQKKYNALHEENQQLRMSPRVESIEIESIVCENQQLKNEVDRLHKENQELKQAYEDAKSDVEKYEQIIKDIMKDNLLIQDFKEDLE